QTGFRFIEVDLADATAIKALFSEYRPTAVINLAAQAGVRYSLENPQVYIQSNLVGFANLLECCRHHKVEHLVYASSSSVYGANSKLPFAEDDNVDHPVSLYAATKKANELMAYTYSHLYGIPATGLRFFTVYGPWGRPDMSPWLFTSAILEKRPLKVFNQGNMQRDFTYVDDIVEGVVRILDRPPEASDAAPHRVFNIGNNQPVKLMDYIRALEAATGESAILDMQPMQPGDVPATYASIDAIQAVTGFRPHTPLAKGLGEWVAWYRDYTRHVPRVR